MSQLEATLGDLIEQRVGATGGDGCGAPTTALSLESFELRGRKADDPEDEERGSLSALIL